MKKKHRLRVLFAAVLALVFAAGGSTIVGAPSTEEQSVRDAEARWVDALDKRDVVALRAILDEDFVDITWKGEVRDRHAAVAALEDPKRPSMKQTLQNMSIRFAVPDVAVVTGVNVVTGTAPDFTARVRFTDVFVKRDGTWKALSAQETLEQKGQSEPRHARSKNTTRSPIS